MKRTGLCGSLIAGVILLAGCVSYTYYGSVEAPNSLGVQREHVIWWTATERFLWWDTVSGAVNMDTQCSFNNLAFQETSEGIVLLPRPDLKTAPGVPTNLTFSAVSGEIEGRIGREQEVAGRGGSLRVQDLGTGKILVSVYAEPVSIASNAALIKASAKPYEVEIHKAPSKTFAPRQYPQPPCP